jgi:SMC interacting uncharacterized protein involved in chromosome segregation
VSDTQDNEEFYKGMAHAHEVVYQNIERLQRSISDVMSIYQDMQSPTYEDNPQVRELEVAWRTLALFRDLFVDNYDEAMDKVKMQEWREASDDLKID